MMFKLVYYCGRLLIDICGTCMKMQRQKIKIQLAMLKSSYTTIEMDCSDFGPSHHLLRLGTS